MSSVTKLLIRAREIYTGVNTNKVYFASPTPTPATLLTQIQALETAQQAVPTRVAGASAARDAKVNALISTLEALKLYVQGLADAAPPDLAVMIIQAAGMRVKAAPAPKALLSITPTQPPGTVMLRANVKAITRKKQGNKTVRWGYSTDGGKTWIESATPHAHTTLSGLPLGVEIAFRCRISFAKGGESDWCPPVYATLR
jgi:hypothetical protein